MKNKKSTPSTPDRDMGFGKAKSGGKLEEIVNPTAKRNSRDKGTKFERILSLSPPDQDSGLLYDVLQDLPNINLQKTSQKRYLTAKEFGDGEELTRARPKSRLQDPDTQAPTTLPDSPPKLWPGRPRGRPVTDGSDPLLTFLREVYGPYLPQCGDQLSSFIRTHDYRLYQAINQFKRTRKLPDDLPISTEPERVRERLRRAAGGAYYEMPEKERASVRKKLLREQRMKPS